MVASGYVPGILKRMIRGTNSAGKKKQAGRPEADKYHLESHLKSLVGVVDVVHDHVLDDLNQYHLKSLVGLVRPLKVHYFGVLRSTNSHALRMRREGRLFAPALVVTSQQTAGRGRSGHSWWSRRGSLTATWVLPVEEAYAPHQLSLIVGLALRAACVEMAGTDDIQLKWPNDVVCHGLKLAGILCERSEGVDLVGIGLNLNLSDACIPLSLRGSVVSLSELAGRQFDINVAIATITGHLKRVLLGRTSHPFATFLQDYRKCDALLGQQISVKTESKPGDVCGECEGIDRQGELLVRDATGLHRLISGSVMVR